MDILSTILLAALAGGARGGLGWYNNYVKQNANSRFDVVKLLPTILLNVVFAGIIAGISTYLGLGIVNEYTPLLSLLLAELMQIQMKTKPVQENAQVA